MDIRARRSVPRATGFVTLMLAVAIVVGIVAATVSGCALFDTKVDNLVSLMKGRQATIMTFNVSGQRLDRIHGASVNITRDTTFDSINADGTSNADSSVIMVSIGGGIMNHVGSTLLMIEDGLLDISDKLPATVDLNNTDRGVPLMNYLRQNFRNLWAGTSRTVVVRSQTGSPIAIFGGNKVTYYATDVPKSTLLSIDDKYLLIYRADYSFYDNSMLD